MWHEEQIDRKMVIKEKIDEYVQSFTVHGLTKIFVGTRLESLFWLIILVGGMLLTVVLIYGLAAKYFRYEVYTEIRSQLTDKNYLPSVTFCDYELLIDAYFAYCQLPVRHSGKRRHKDCSFKNNVNFGNTTTTKEYVYWSNSIFNVTKCFTWDRKQCISNKYFKSLSHFNHSCMTWNYNGDLHDMYSHVVMEFQFKSYSPERIPWIIAVPHDPEIHEIDLTTKVDLEPFKSYEIRMDKTIIKRLPFPYPSNCTNSNKGDIFPGKYTRRSCLESHKFIEMYKECGDTLDYIRKYIPDDIKRRYYRNITVKEAESCIWQVGKSETKTRKYCAFPCEELQLGTIVIANERDASKYRGNISTYRISLQYQAVDSYKVMEEKPIYLWDQLASEVGGLIGLMIGASLISLVEIIAYIFLVAYNFVI